MESYRIVDKKILIRIGNFIGDLFILQISFVLYALRGGVILGIWPSLLAVMKCLIEIFYNSNPDVMRVTFRETYNQNFKLSNMVGWPAAGFLALLIYEYGLNERIIQNDVLRIALPVLIILMLIMISHLPITVLRFDLSFKDYFKQAMLIALSSPFELISILLSFVLIEYVFTRLAIIPLFFFAPIVAMPFAWFSYNSVEKIIKKRSEM